MGVVVLVVIQDKLRRVYRNLKNNDHSLTSSIHILIIVFIIFTEKTMFLVIVKININILVIMMIYLFPSMFTRGGGSDADFFILGASLPLLFLHATIISSRTLQFIENIGVRLKHFTLLRNSIKKRHTVGWKTWHYSHTRST